MVNTMDLYAASAAVATPMNFNAMLPRELASDSLLLSSRWLSFTIAFIASSVSLNQSPALSKLSAPSSTSLAD